MVVKMHLAPGGRQRIARAVTIAALTVSGLLMAGILLVLVRWPFSKASVERALGKVLSSRVEIKEFHKIYFPHPGCTARGVTFRDGRWLGEVDQLTVEGDYGDIVMGRERVGRVIAQGMHVQIHPNADAGSQNAA